MGHKVPGFLLSCMSLKRQLKRRAAGEREEAVADEGAFLGEAAAAAAAAAGAIVYAGYFMHHFKVRVAKLSWNA